MPLTEGVLAGYRVVIKGGFYDGKQHPVDSKDMHFKWREKKLFEKHLCKPNHVS
ncbi:MAG: hypothetical protein CM1200mP1_08390 [Candidatus Neomarinimicrobiota bacterium]|nr:MAG: hypothetical protein CM1200mP1_08390 [Candidatus Neomarinimicrobiota bacterium]